ncbi:hypothetical protein [Rhodococcus sp. O3]|uniref:hypothetical protein n=1 Tax=Rhodococcus sp. O3 TaxID=3404919 RepID=UPI003B67BE99
MRSDGRIITVLGPARLPSAEHITATAARLIHASAGRTPLGFVPDPANSRWRYDPVRFAPVVEVVEPCTYETVPQKLVELARTIDSAIPLRIVLAGEYLFVDLCHGLGDGRLALLLHSHLARPATDTSPPAWASSRSLRAPASRAAFRAAVTCPSRLGALWRVVTSRLASATPPHRPDPVERPWHRSPAVVTASAGPELLDTLRRRRDRDAPHASSSAILFAAVERAARAHGLSLASSIDVLVDCRRYLPINAVVLSNFVSAMGVRTADNGDINHLGRAMADALAVGQPLVALALSTAKYRRAVARGRVPAVAHSVPSRPCAHMVFSDLGQVESVLDLDWTATPDRRFANALSEPAHPESIVVTIVRRGRHLDVTASFHDNVFAPGTVQAVLDEALAVPSTLWNDKPVDTEERI